MTLDRTAARARCEAATETVVDMAWGHHNDECPCDWDADDEMDPDCPACKAIAVVEKDLPAALDELDAKDAEIERLRKLLLDWCRVPWGCTTMHMTMRTKAALEGRD